MAKYEAVLFDWMLTLADYPDERQHVRRGCESIGRAVGDDDLDAIVARLSEAAREPEVEAAAAGADCSPDLHRAATMLHFARASIDAELADAMYDLLGTPSFHPIYPEAMEVVSRLASRGVRIAVTTDIHVDLRVHAQLSGLDRFVDEWIPSCEAGVQKPDPAIFQAALDAPRALSRGGTIRERRVAACVLDVMKRATDAGELLRSERSRPE